MASHSASNTTDFIPGGRQINRDTEQIAVGGVRHPLQRQPHDGDDDGKDDGAEIVGDRPHHGAQQWRPAHGHGDEVEAAAEQRRDGAGRQHRERHDADLDRKPDGQRPRQ
jgi:hypothetical protein